MNQRTVHAVTAAAYALLCAACGDMSEAAPAEAVPAASAHRDELSLAGHDALIADDAHDLAGANDLAAPHAQASFGTTRFCDIRGTGDHCRGDTLITCQGTVEVAHASCAFGCHVIGAASDACFVDEGTCPFGNVNADRAACTALSACGLTCGQAGGDQCLGGSGSCPGAWRAASDCDRCCASAAPRPERRSFHVVHLADTYAYDAIVGLVQAGKGPIIASTNRPDSVSSQDWAHKVSPVHFQCGEDLADYIANTLAGPDAPAFVIIDELNGSSKDKVHDAARRLAAVYPEWTGRWGAFVVNGEGVAYPNLNTAPTRAIDALLDAHAVIAPEFYVRQSRYCQAGSNAATRDTWLGDFFRGSRGAFANKGRFHWLMERRKSRRSESHVSPTLGVIDNYGNGTQPARFFDRMMYVWMAKSGYRGYVLAGGGFGAWKWDQPKMSNTSRDAAFAASFDHYVVAEATGARLGAVPCQ